MAGKKRVLLVCLGNTCRSPIGEAVFQRIIRKEALEDRWEVDSAALMGYHTGESPNHRAISILRANGITDYAHKARTITADDFEKFDWIFGMDDENIHRLNGIKPLGSKAKVELLGQYDPQGEVIIKDPYLDDTHEGFVKAYEQCTRSAISFLEKHSEQ